MLKGHVFSRQLFGNPIFALFINTFLNGQNGISDNYKNLTIVDSSGGIEVIKDEHGHENPWIWLSVQNYMAQIKL